MNDYLPDDADGDALRRLAATGSDLTREMEIDFAVDIPDRETGLAFAAIVRPAGFQTRVNQDDETGDWTCYCSCTMVPTYDEMIAAQKTLEELGRPFGARPDGWGSFGNAPN
jgi:hypothetical protein